MSGEILRKAAALMRERAEKATPGPWWNSPHIGVFSGTGSSDDVLVTEEFRLPADATHIASWHPAVALAVADWLDHEAGQAERCFGDPAGGSPIYGEPSPHALAVARAYLGDAP